MAMERRGFGVHALEVWQKSSHVKRAARNASDGRRSAQKFLRACGERQIYFKCDFRKMRAEKIPAPFRERSAIFVFT